MEEGQAALADRPAGAGSTAGVASQLWGEGRVQCIQCNISTSKQVQAAVRAPLSSLAVHAARVARDREIQWRPCYHIGPRPTRRAALLRDDTLPSTRCHRTANVLDRIRHRETPAVCRSLSIDIHFPMPRTSQLPPVIDHLSMPRILPQTRSVHRKSDHRNANPSRSSRNTLPTARRNMWNTSWLPRSISIGVVLWNISTQDQ